MPTDTTIIDRLRGLAEMMGSDGEAEAEASAIMLAAADALTAAHAARDAALEAGRKMAAYSTQHFETATANYHRAEALEAQLNEAKARIKVLQESLDANYVDAMWRDYD